MYFPPNPESNAGSATEIQKRQAMAFIAMRS
jgi:hypothetical protein